jgi:TolA-binding protein
MAKFKSGLCLTLVTIICGAVFVGGCTNDESAVDGKIEAVNVSVSQQEQTIANLQRSIDELQNSLNEVNEQFNSYKTATQNLILNNLETGVYTLSDMYELGVISRNDLMSIAYYSNSNSSKNNEDIIPKDFVPQSINPEELSDETKKKIKQSYCVADPIEGLTVDNVIITQYYGTYNGFPVVVMHYDKQAYLTATGREIIDGIWITTNYAADILYVYKENK